MFSVLHISTSTNGGAGIAANRLHGALRTQAAESRMVVTNGENFVGDIMQLSGEMHGFRMRQRFETWKLRIERSMASKDVSRKLAYFSDDRVPGKDRLNVRPDADVLNLHWVANFLDYGKFFPSVRSGQPLVWTLHDMAPMTGGCHYAMNCKRFTEECGVCPQLGSTHLGDLTRRIHSRKTAALGALCPETTRIVAPSNWLANEARRSSLLQRFQVDVIPNGLDVETFAPRDRHVAREVLGFPHDRRIILFAADNVSDYRKGMDLLLSAFESSNDLQNVILVSMGGGVGRGPADSVGVGRIDNARLMSFVYNAADVFVLPTRADNLPNVLVESMACGTPCVSFRVGGVPDVVRDGETGLLAEPEDVASLRRCIVNLLKDNEMHKRMSQASREIAVTEYADTIVARRYMALYKELIEKSNVLRGGAQ
jgi:glycosyltransferase involved in cell wall biosynthesis